MSLRTLLEGFFCALVVVAVTARISTTVAYPAQSRRLALSSYREASRS